MKEKRRFWISIIHLKKSPEILLVLFAMLRQAAQKSQTLCDPACEISAIWLLNLCLDVGSFPQDEFIWSTPV